MGRGLAVLLSCAACASVPTAGPVALATPGPGVLHAVSCGAVTAQWLGTPAADSPPLFGAETLQFTFPGGAALPFKPTGSLNFSDWSSEIFSPTCAWVLLLQDRFGPYHLVKLERLAAYLEGAAPEAVVETKTPAGEAQVHSEQQWGADDTFEYFASAGGDVAVVRGQAQKPQLRAVVFEAKDVPRGIRRTAIGFEPLQ